MAPGPFSLGAAAFCVAVAALSAADTVVLTSGRTLEGRLAEATDKQLRLETFAGPRSIPRDRVAKHTPKGGAAFEKYEAAAQAGVEDPAAQMGLARTCLEHRGFARAREHVEKAGTLGAEEAKVAAFAQELDKAQAAWRKGLPQPVGVVFKVGTIQILDGGAKRVPSDSRALGP
jgi:hypothetical protein